MEIPCLQQKGTKPGRRTAPPTPGAGGMGVGEGRDLDAKAWEKRASTKLGSWHVSLYISGFSFPMSLSYNGLQELHHRPLELAESPSSPHLTSYCLEWRKCYGLSSAKNKWWDSGALLLQPRFSHYALGQEPGKGKETSLQGASLFILIINAHISHMRTTRFQK